MPKAPVSHPHPQPFVREELDSQSMHFSDAAIQSRISSFSESIDGHRCVSAAAS